MFYPRLPLPNRTLVCRLLIALLIITNATILAACGRDEPTPVPAAAPTEKPVGELVAAATNAAATSATSAPAAAPASTSVPSQPSPPTLTGHITIWHSWAQAQGDA